MARLLLLTACTLASVQALFPDCQHGPLKSNRVCDSSASTTDRARALVDAMTLAEKFNQTGNQTPGVPRLGLPPYNYWQEALHGVASSPGVNFSTNGDYSYATSFPQPILMGAAFDDDLIQSVASVISTEARAFNNANRSGLDYWTPNINPFRSGNWGRGAETPGEDPFHLQSYVKHLINGLQGGLDPKIKKVISTCKHWAAYDIEDWHGNERNSFDARVTTQELAEYYTPPFQTCARDSNVGSIMCSYNALNGVPTCADPYLLQTILREKWGWTKEDQYVTSDCDAIQNVYKPHGYASSPEQAVAATLQAGCDLNCGTYYPLHLPSAYQMGLVNETMLDTSLVRLFSALVKVGYFDPPSATPYRSLTFSDVSTPSAQALALRAAEEGIVLLKNDNDALPLKIPANGTNLSIALLGSYANATTQMQGNYYGQAPFLHSPLYAAQQLKGVTVNYAPGVGGRGDPTTNDWLSSYAAVMDSDIVIIMDGIDTTIESEGHDRNLLNWSGTQIDFIENLASMGKPTVLVQFGGGQLDDTPFLNNSNIGAIVWAGYGGQDGGTAVINTLFGKVAPAGRLPITQYPSDYLDLAPMTNMNLRPNLPSFPGRTYMWYSGSVVPFGFGLHYTTFSAKVGSPSTPSKLERAMTPMSISQLVSSCDRAQYKYLDLCPAFQLPVQVSNTGNTTSDYVTLGFIKTTNAGPPPYPIKRLVAYQRLFAIGPGQTQTARLNMTLASLGRVDEDGNTVLYPGQYSILVDEPTKATISFELTGSATTIDFWPKRPSQG